MTTPWLTERHGYDPTFWLLSSGNVIQQNKTEGWIINDSKDMRLYVGYSDGTPAFVLKYGEQPISGLVNQEKVDIQDKKVDIGNIKVDIEI